MNIPGKVDNIIYLASPYTHDDQRIVNQRHRDICEISANMMRAGKIVFSPIAHTHEMARLHKLDAKWGEFWERQCLAMVKACDEFGIVRLPGWVVSNGMIAEHNYAFDIGKPIIEIDPEDWLRKW